MVYAIFPWPEGDISAPVFIIMTGFIYSTLHVLAGCFKNLENFKIFSVIFYPGMQKHFLTRIINFLWISVVLNVIFRFAGVALYFVYKVDTDDPTANPLLWLEIFGWGNVLIYPPLTYIWYCPEFYSNCAHLKNNIKVEKE